MDPLGEHERYERRQVDDYLRAMWSAYAAELEAIPATERARCTAVCAAVLVLQAEHAEPNAWYPF